MGLTEREMIDKLWTELLEQVPFLPLDVAIYKMVEHHDFWENGGNIDRTSEAIMDAVMAKFSLERRKTDEVVNADAHGDSEGRG